MERPALARGKKTDEQTDNRYQEPRGSREDETDKQ